MKRRGFLTVAGAAVGGLSMVGGAPATAQETAVKPMLGGLKHPKLRMSLRNIDGFFSGSLRERLEQVAAWGATAYETVPKDCDIATLAAEADRLGLPMCVTGGAGSIGETSMLDPANHAELIATFKSRIPDAKRLRCKRLLCLAGKQRDDIPVKQQNAYVVECLKRMGDICDAEDMMIVLETLNVLVNHPGYFVSTTAHTMEILEAVDNPRVTMLFDIYHQQISEGNVIRNLTENIDRIGHFHFADNPGRHEPGTGELNYTNVFKAIAATNYQGYVSSEFSPIDKSPEGKIRALNAIAQCLQWS